MGRRVVGLHQSEDQVLEPIVAEAGEEVEAPTVSSGIDEAHVTIVTAVLDAPDTSQLAPQTANGGRRPGRRDPRLAPHRIACTGLASDRAGRSTGGRASQKMLGLAARHPVPARTFFPLSTSDRSNRGASNVLIGPNNGGTSSLMRRHSPPDRRPASPQTRASGGEHLDDCRNTRRYNYGHLVRPPSRLGQRHSDLIR
jgi:hypothetical protein